MMIAVLHEPNVSWGWLLWVLIMSFAGTSYAGEPGGWRPSDRATGVDEHASARLLRLITIPNVMDVPRWEPNRPNYAGIARSLGVSEEITSLLDDFSVANDGRPREKPQKILARYLLNKAVEQVPFLPGLRTHIPKGVKFNVDISRRGVIIEVKVPLPALVW